MFNTIHSREGHTAACNTGMANSHKVYRFGIDTLHLTFRGIIKPDFELSLEKLKLLAQSDDSKQYAQVTIPGHIFQVHDRGSGIFPYVISNNCFYIKFSRSSSKLVPLAQVQISSEYLQSVSTLTAYDSIRDVMAYFADIFIEPTVSRCDIFCDFQTDFVFENPDNGNISLSRKNFVTPAKEWRFYGTDMFFTGLQVGSRSNLLYRLYDKTYEIKKVDKLWMLDLWKQSGWDGEGVIWRSEFQVETSVLKQLGLMTVRDILNSIDAFWSYLTRKWLRITDYHPDRTHVSRDAVVLPFWSVIQSASGFTVNPKKRMYSTAKIPSEEKIVRFGLAGLTSFMAARGISELEDGIFQFFDTARLQQYSRGSINDYLAYHITRKNRIYCTVDNNSGYSLVAQADADIPF